MLFIICFAFSGVEAEFSFFFKRMGWNIIWMPCCSKTGQLCLKIISSPNFYGLFANGHGEDCSMDH